VSWLAVIPDNIPSRLRDRAQWLLWRGEILRDGRPTKVPYMVGYPSRHASVDAPTTWGRFDDAIDAQSCPELRMDGVGYVLTADDGLVGIDLDKCRDRETGVIAPWALAIVQRIDSYTEISPSGSGVRIFARGTLTGNGRNRNGVEMYARGRYLTLTGHRLHGTL
jgi:primase-polymerase (primpol)-like protein